MRENKREKREFGQGSMSAKYFIWYGGYSLIGNKPKLKEIIEANGAKAANKYARDKYGKNGWAEIRTQFTIKEAKKLGLLK